MLKITTLLRITVLSLLLTVMITGRSWGQKKNDNVIAYIKKYSHIAVDNMDKFAIPASVTMAQGLLESGFGLSELSKKSNNHFGIKCKKDWKGERVFHDDDEIGECFRKYDCVEDSYADHARFLVGNIRYADLFSLRYDDYKGWAFGLKKAGYATNPKYPDILINLIELYELNKLDNKKQRREFMASYSDKPLIAAKPAAKPTTPKNNKIKASNAIAIFIINGHKIYSEDRDRYTFATGEDSYTVLSKKVKVSKRKIAKYNDVEDMSATPEQGTKIYIRKKRSQ